MKDPAHLAKLRGTRCAAHGLRSVLKESDPCSGPVEAHHRTGAGLALKASDHEAFPLCQKHHRDFHDSKGMFRSWTKQEKKEWQLKMVERYRP